MKKTIVYSLFLILTLNVSAQSPDSIAIATYSDIYGKFEKIFKEMQKKEKWNTDWAKFNRYAGQNRKIVKPPKVVFMGNSITEGWIKADSAFFKNNEFVDRGIGGQTSSEMLVRFQADVIDLKPQIAVISAGTNDLAQNNGKIEKEHILQNIISMCELAKYHHIKPIVASVLPASSFNWHKELSPANEIIELNKMIKAYADQNRIPYVDYHSALKDEKNGMPLKYSKDGCHPNKECYAIMESIVLEIIRKYVATPYKLTMSAQLNTSGK
ncbi:MAG TPA: GDSL-type esterase/lipase family protein [Paludibacter sp.]|nr:GDSL-type esterase/lipase family protein [Paludibacter sp.]